MIQTGISEGNTKGYAAESNGFAQLAMTTESKCLIGLFQSKTECMKNKFGESKIEIRLVFVKSYNSGMCMEVNKCSTFLILNKIVDFQ